MVIIGLTGQTASGKGEVVRLLTNNYGFNHYSARSFLSRILRESNQQVSIKTLSEVANNLRKTFGPNHVVRSLFDQIPQADNKAIIESVRHPEEITFLKKNAEKFYLISVTAPLSVRWERTKKDKKLADDAGLAKFIQLEKIASNPVYFYEQNVEKCIGLSDFIIENNGTKEELIKKLENIMSMIQEEGCK